MSARAFPFDNIEREGQRFSAMRIECSKCGGTSHFVQTGNKRRPPEAAQQYFRNHGWIVGNGPRADVCPSCQPRKKPELKVVEAAEKPKADPPREMTRVDRRIINDKLDEVYGEDKYVSPWTDAAVARDLGVPRVWVEQVREEFFGPAGSNEEFDEFLEKAAPIIAETKNLFRAAQSQLEQARAIEAKIADLEKLAKRVEREIGR